MRTLLTIVGTVFVVAIGLLVIAGPRMKEIAAAMRSGAAPTSVRVQQAAPGEVTEVVTAPGLVEPFRKVDISAEVSARVVSLPFREGEFVHKGDVVVKLDDRDLKAALQSTMARRDAEKYRLQSEQQRLAGPIATLDYQRKSLERQQKLLTTGDVSQQVVDEAEERVRDLEASIASARQTIAVLESSLAAADGDIARAEEAVRRTTIISPIDGLVTRLNAEVGELALVGTMNNPGTVILTVADLSRMLLKAEVAETDVARLAANQKSRIHINAYPDTVFTGTLERVDLQRTEKTGQTPYFEAEISIDLDGRQVLAGLAANVDVEIETHRGLVVPSQAVLQRPVEELPVEVRDSAAVDSSRRVVPVVYRMIDGKAVCTPVRLGASDLTTTLIRDGLAAGDTVVIGPFKTLEKIKHNDPIRIEDSAKESRAAEARDGSSVQVRM
ncbi:MAG: efflux RND transporter periplasmic adaptor subunit [Phycisphaerales bacterium]